MTPITNVITTESHKNGTNNKNKEYICSFSIWRHYSTALAIVIKLPIKKHFLSCRKRFHFLLSTVRNFVSPNKNDRSSPELTLTIHPTHNKTILISPIRTKIIERSFFWKWIIFICTSPICINEVWNVSSYTHLSGLQREWGEEKMCFWERWYFCTWLWRTAFEMEMLRNPHSQEQHHATNWCELYLWRIKINTTTYEFFPHPTFILIWDSFMIKQLWVISE